MGTWRGGVPYIYIYVYIHVGTVSLHVRTARPPRSGSVARHPALPPAVAGAGAQPGPSAAQPFERGR